MPSSSASAGSRNRLRSWRQRWQFWTRPPLPLAAELAGLDIAEAEDAADALTRAHLLSPGEPLSLIHPLIAAAVLADLPERARGRAHRKAAAAACRFGRRGGPRRRAPAAYPSNRRRLGERDAARCRARMPDPLRDAKRRAVAAPCAGGAAAAAIACGRPWWNSPRPRRPMTRPTPSAVWCRRWKALRILGNEPTLTTSWPACCSSRARSPSPPRPPNAGSPNWLPRTRWPAS